MSKSIKRRYDYKTIGVDYPDKDGNLKNRDLVMVPKIEFFIGCGLLVVGGVNAGIDLAMKYFGG